VPKGPTRVKHAPRRGSVAGRSCSPWLYIEVGVIASKVKKDRAQDNLQTVHRSRKP